MDGVLQFINSYTTTKRGFVLEILICEVLFAIGSKPRRWGKIPVYISIPLSMIGFYAFGIFVPSIKVPTLPSLMIFAVSIIVHWACLDLSVNRAIFNCVGAYAVQSLAINLREAFFLLVDMSGWGKTVVRIAITLAVYTIGYLAFARERQKDEMNIKYVRLYLVSFLTVVITNLMFVLFRQTHMNGLPVKLVLSICCILALVLQYSTFKNGSLNKETAIMEQLLSREQKLHELSQATIDVINIKAHDLKSQIAILRQKYGEEADDIIGDVEKAVTAYSEMVSTGNKNLDLVINEEKMIGDKYGIKIDVIADGSLVGFMSPSDVYSLFGNALRNAVECVASEKDGLRNISFDMHRSGDYVVTEISNYCSHNVDIEKGRPKTSKENNGYHGYGILSMERVVNKYGGNMVLNYSDNTFIVKIIFAKAA